MQTLESGSDEKLGDTICATPKGSERSLFRISEIVSHTSFPYPPSPGSSSILHSGTLGGLKARYGESSQIEYHNDIRRSNIIRNNNNNSFGHYPTVNLDITNF